MDEPEAQENWRKKAEPCAGSGAHKPSRANTMFPEALPGDTDCIRDRIKVLGKIRFRADWHSGMPIPCER